MFLYTVSKQTWLFIGRGARSKQEAASEENTGWRLRLRLYDFTHQKRTARGCGDQVSINLTGELRRRWISVLESERLFLLACFFCRTSNVCFQTFEGFRSLLGRTNQTLVLYGRTWPETLGGPTFSPLHAPGQNYVHVIDVYPSLSSTFANHFHFPVPSLPHDLCSIREHSCSPICLRFCQSLSVSFHTAAFRTR